MINLVIIVIGLSGAVAQIILLRELLVAFCGNELSVGVILGNWLVLEALGSFLIGRYIEKAKNKVSLYIATESLFSVILPAAIHLARVVKIIIGVPLGQEVGLVSILWSSFIVLLPVSIAHGALFTFSCKLYSEVVKKSDIYSISRVYVLETIGTIVGGFTITYLLMPYLNSYQIAISTSLINFICCALLSILYERKIFIFANSLAAVFASYLLLSNKVEHLHRGSLRAQWKNQNIVSYRNSIYGNIVVTEQAGEYTLFYNGLPFITTPHPNISYVEEFTHIPMLSHPSPKKVLVISRGCGGQIFEILKYKTIDKIDYVEPDPAILEVLKKFPTELTKMEFQDPKVNIYHLDGRLFTKIATSTYDIIYLGISEPTELQTNRFFTVEFFNDVARKLSPGGIFVLCLPGSLTYLSPELKKINHAMIATLKKAFPYIKVVPGDYNMFLCSNTERILNLTPQALYRRLLERKVITSLLSRQYIEYKLDNRWERWFSEEMCRVEHIDKVNYDFKPSAMFYMLSYWNAKFSQTLQKLFSLAEKISLSCIVVLILGFTFLICIFGIFLKADVVSPKAAIPYVVGSTGFVGMMFDLLLVFGFQVLYGYVYYQIGVITTLFMVGVALGSVIIARYINFGKAAFPLLLMTEIKIILFTSLLAFLFNILQKHFVSYRTVPVFFYILSIFGGMLIGAEFPLANKVYLQKLNKPISSTVGVLYGADLLGGWFGGVVGSIILVPTIGLLETCVVMIVLKASSIVFLLLSSKG
jgi:spermidine synthase